MRMKVSYRPTFSQFADNYLATYYSGGVQTLRRVGGGPLIMLLGALLIIYAGNRVSFWLLRYPLIFIGLAIALYGLSVALGPLFNIFLVWLRRKQLFENKKSLTTLELKARHLHVDQSGERVKVPLDHIQTIQHRSESSWILTRSGTLLYIPRAGLVSGDHDQFVQALEEKLTPPETNAP